MIKFKKMLAGLASVTGVVAALATACGPAEEAAPEVERADQELYLTGKIWPKGIVNVCHNADLTVADQAQRLAHARRIVENSWGRAANLSFPGWEKCPTFTSEPFSAVHISFTTNPRSSSEVGVDPSFLSWPGSWRPGFTEMKLSTTDTSASQRSFRYAVIHEFGHALGFTHEQERPDNWTGSGEARYCDQLDNGQKKHSGGTYQTPYDPASVMNYCARDPLIGGSPTQLSAWDLVGIRKVYGRNAAAHGFMITSDRNPGLAVNAWNGAVDGAELKLTDLCQRDNPDCTWSFQRGMLVSDRDPTLAISVTNTSVEGAKLILSAACTPADSECLWTYTKGQFVSVGRPKAAINASGGAQPGTPLTLTSACDASNPDCTWTLPNVMLSSARDTALAVNAFGGAADGVELKLSNQCTPDNGDCTWTFHKGSIVSDANPGLWINAAGGATHGTSLKLSAGCNLGNPDCTWTWRKGQLLSDNGGTLPMNAFGGAVHAAPMKLDSTCTLTNPDCLFPGLAARH